MALLIGLVILLVVTLGAGLVIGVRSARVDKGQTQPLWIHRLDNFFAGLRWVGYKWLRLSELFFAVLTAAVLIVLLIIILPVARRQTIDIQPIAVPKYLADRGYTSEVATERLRDAIDRIIFQAASSMEPPHFMSSAPDIVIHEVWLQPEAIAAWLGNWLHLRRRQDISGEITMADDGSGCGELRLRVRFNGESFPGSESTVALKAVNTSVLPLVSQLTNEAIDPSALGLPNEEIDKLFNAAADGILELTNPYFVAVSCFTYNSHEREVSRELLDRIVAIRPETGEATAEEVAGAHDVLGVLNFSDDYGTKRDERPEDWGEKNAVAELVLAMKADPHLSNPPHYLASIIYEQARNEKRALENNRKGHWSWSDYRAKLRRAAALFDQAVTLNGEDADALNDEAEFLLESGEVQLNGRASELYHRAIQVSKGLVSQNPRNGYAYMFAGRAWLGLSKIEAKREDIKKTDLEKAHTALVRAIELTPLNFGAYYYNILAKYYSLPKGCQTPFSKPVPECNKENKKILEEAWEARRKLIMVVVDQEDEEEDDYERAIRDLKIIDKRFEDDDEQLRGKEIPPCPRNYLMQGVPSWVPDNAHFLARPQPQRP